MAELIGAAGIIYVKDVDGLYTANPRTRSDATFIKEIGARRLIEMDLPDLPFDRELPHCLQNSRTVDKINLINGLKPDSLRRVFRGEEVGSIIKAGGRRLQ
jgi:molybdenum storage protein